MNNAACRRIVLALLFACRMAYAQSQEPGWTKGEVKYYKTVTDLCHYLRAHVYDTAKRDFIFKSYVYFDYVLNDTVENRVRNRIARFDAFFMRFQYFIDSVGVENLDAKPVRFFKNDPAFFKPFAEELEPAVPMTFAYYDKRRPGKPIGALLFDEATHKLVAWILINQGGYYYFLTFNLFGGE